ncbi:hypothetical protein GGF50DRAFT_118629 [Schizophyllum commune]
MHAEELLEQAASMASLELQRDGYIPSAPQSRHIHDMSRALSSETSSIETEIARLQCLHRRIIIQLDVHKSITAPIRRLPLELLSEIFAILFDREGESHGKAYIVIYVISRVCSAWRALVRATPRLWTRIPTRVFSPELEMSLAHFHHVPDHISLSGSLPLCLTHIEPNDDALLEKFLVKLGPHLARIGFIDFDGSCAYFAAVANNHRMPNAFEAGMALSGPLLPGTLDFLGNSPALRQVELFHGYRYQANYARDFRFPALPALTWLTLEFRGIISTDAILQLLYTCRDSLQHLSLALYFSHDAYTTGPVALSALSELVVDRGAYTVLAYLSAPELESLRCMSKMQTHGAVTTVDLYIDPFPLLRSFISRMPRPRELQELHIGPIMRSANTFASFLDALDDVEELSIAEGMRSGFVSEDALIWLTCADNSQPHLPGLKKIELNLSPHPGQAHRIRYTLGLMLESRRMEALLERLASLGLQRPGFIPTRAQRQELKRISEELSSDLAATDQDAWEPSNLHKTVSDALEAIRYATAPILLLPPELLADIFDHFVWCHNRRYRAGRAEYLLEFLSRAPALKELDLRTFEIGPPSPPVIRLPFFGRLTRLVLRCRLCVDIDWFLSVLQACSRSMTNLAMDHVVLVGVPRSSLQTMPITLSALTHLGYNTTSSEFLRCIETPTLEELELNNIGDGSPFPALSDFISRLPHVENINDIYLEIIDSEDPEPFLDCVASLVGLRRVFIMLAEGVSFFTVEALERLSCDAGHQPLLPKLEELCIYHIDGEATPNPALVDAMREMVRTRAEASRVYSDAVVALKVFTDFDDLEAVGDGEE